MSEPPGVTLRAVLVADDDPDQRFLLQRLFRRAGTDEVVEAGDGAAALEAVRARRFDLVVLDVSMPVRSGIDVLPDLHDAAGGTPIVVLSNFSRERLGAIAVERGAVGYVEKRTPVGRLLQELLLAAAITGVAQDSIVAGGSARFPSDRTASRLARGFVREHAEGADEELLGIVDVLVSEVVANAVLHAGSEPRVRVELGPELLRVEVADDDPTPPRRRRPDVGSPGGRGLLLLDELASRWGSEPTDGGKVVWFEVDRPPAG